MKFYKIEHEITEHDVTFFRHPNQKIAVVIHIIDSKGNILLQQRGKQSRDEIGLYEEVSGKVEKEDTDYKSAILREMKEEMGSEAIITEIKTIGLFHVPKDVDWLFVVFSGIYEQGPIRIMEPEKCMGYRFFSYEEILNSNETSESCKYLVKSLKQL